MRDQSKISGEAAGLSAKLRAFIAGLTPSMIFRFTLISSLIVALAAGILYRTASESLHVNIDKVDTASISLAGSDNLGGDRIGWIQLSQLQYNESIHKTGICVHSYSDEHNGTL